MVWENQKESMLLIYLDDNDDDDCVQKITLKKQQHKNLDI